MTDLLQGLNEAQRDAVTSTEGFVRVIAGAGSGKTRALSRRFAFLTEDLGILPGHILCCTFTNKSAEEMRQRIRRLTGGNGTGYINTFHGFCVSVLQEDSHAVQYPSRFLVLDNQDIDAMLQIIYDERGLTLQNMTFSQARDMIEMRKLFRNPDYYEDMIALSLEGLKERYDQAAAAEDIIFYGYLYQEKKCFALDYNDLIKFTLYIFRENEGIRLKWQQRLEYIMIDEFQDIDGLQYALMEVLCAYHKNLFVVGDPDQTIYTWRGANTKYLMEFDQHFPGTKTILMNTNYRSTPNILRAANALIEKNKRRIPKELHAVKAEGAAVVCHLAGSQVSEGEWMAEEIARLHQGGTPLSRIAILYRAHYVTRAVETALLQKQIPYAIYSGAPFFGRAEIKDALSYLRMVAYRDDLSFRRVINTPRRNLGKRRMAFLEEYAASRGCSLYQALKDNLEEPILRGTGARRFIALIESFSSSLEGRAVSDLLAALLNASGYETMLRTEGSQERLDNLAELKQSIYEYETTCGEEVTLTDYLSRAALLTNTDTLRPGEAVRLMTVHAAKGLEFPIVFLCGMSEGIFPSRKTLTPEAMEEERRLCFVAVTRAEDRLYLSCADGWNFNSTPRYLSRFLLDMGRDNLAFTRPLRDEVIREVEAYVQASIAAMEAPAAPGWAAGQRVRHPVFGEGTILAADDATCLIQFDRMDTPRQLTLRAKLEPLTGGTPP